MDQIQGETHDNEIIKRILDGDIDEFALLLKRYQDFVFSIVTKLALFPPMLNTVNFPTWSALGNTSRNSMNDLKFLNFINLYQC